MEQFNKIVLESLVVQVKDLATADMEEEKVMMNIDKGKYYAVNCIGCRIWNLMESAISVNGIINILLKEYKVDIETCRQSVLEFLNKLYAEGLVYIE